MPTLKQIFAARVDQIIRSHPEINSATKLAKKSIWPRGKKKGTPVSARAMSYALRTDDDAPSPALDLVEAVANYLGVDAWELLTDNVEARRKIIEKLLDEAHRVPDARLTGGPFDASGKPKRLPASPQGRFQHRKGS